MTSPVTAAAAVTGTRAAEATAAPTIPTTNCASDQGKGHEVRALIHKAVTLPRPLPGPRCAGRASHVTEGVQSGLATCRCIKA